MITNQQSSFVCFIIALLLILLASCSTMKTVDISPGAENRIRIVNLFDFHRYNEELLEGYGLTFIVETPEATVLLDAGDYKPADPASLVLHNMEMLGYFPDDIDIAFISHWHKSKGLEGIYLKNPHMKVYVPLDDSDKKIYGRDIIRYTAVDESWTEIAPGVHSTGSMFSSSRGINEQAMVIEADDGIIALVSCAHPGIVQMAQRINNRFPDKPIRLLMGGFHLFETDKEQLPAILDSLVELGVEKMSPSHCTGNPFKQLAEEELGDDYIEGGAGLAILY